MHVHIPTQNGGITGTLRQSRPTRQLLILCHGLNSSSDHPALKKIAEQLAAKGHTVFTFNFSRDDTGLNVPQQVHDVEAVIAHFTQFDEFVLLAGSFGALSTAIVAGRSPKVISLVTVNGFFGTKQLGRQAWQRYALYRLLVLAHPKYRSFWRYIQQHLQPQKITVPVLVIHTKRDRVVLIAQSREFYAALPGKKKFLELEESDHDLRVGGEIPLIVGSIDGWVKDLASLQLR